MPDSPAVNIVNSVVRQWSLELMGKLLYDRTTQENIIWADEEYCELGDGYRPYDQIKLNAITGFHSGVIKTRVMKDAERQAGRTKRKAEVFTPSWLCDQMNNVLDDVWFGRHGVFNIQTEDGWETNREGILFEDARGRRWKDYVDCRKLEITCGEAPFLCSRYDTTTGCVIPAIERIGILDRKLRVVTENAETYDEWLKWAYRALESTYGYEYQGDSLIVARVNALMTFAEHMHERWGQMPDEKEAAKAALIITWNIWQMDGLRGCVPSEWDVPEHDEFEAAGESNEEAGQMSPSAQPCMIYDWRAGAPQTWESLKGRAASMKRFFGAVGNPPYQQETEGTSHAALPIYNHFMEESFKVSERVELVTPARFLFNAGRTPKEWNRERLHDPHFKVLLYENDGSVVFPSTDIKGGVAVSYRDSTTDFGEIGVFTPFPEMKSVLEKVEPFLASGGTMQSVAHVASKFNLDEAIKEYPDMAGRERRMSSNVLKLPIFKDKPSSPDDVAILGLEKPRRTKKYIARKYVEAGGGNLDGYKVVLPKAIGSGAFGETLSGPGLEEPNEGYTHTFMGLGNLGSFEEGEALLKYVKSKFARAMLGLLKVTQDNTPDKWAKVPLQNFTDSSDIDWSKSISEIDQQLYRKYGLDGREVEFIEARVKEMS